MPSCRHMSSSLWAYGSRTPHPLPTQMCAHALSNTQCSSFTAAQHAPAARYNTPTLAGSWEHLSLSLSPSLSLSSLFTLPSSHLQPNQSFVVEVDLIPPPKAAALAWLDSTATAPPPRFARVTVIRGAASPPDCMDYQARRAPAVTMFVNLHHRGSTNCPPFLADAGPAIGSCVSGLLTECHAACAVHASFVSLHYFVGYIGTS